MYMCLSYSIFQTVRSIFSKINNNCSEKAMKKICSNFEIILYNTTAIKKTISTFFSEVYIFLYKKSVYKWVHEIY